jgi:hypothetical protein
LPAEIKLNMEFLQLMENPMSYRYPGDLRALHKHELFGTGECVDLIKVLVPGLIGLVLNNGQRAHP